MIGLRVKLLDVSFPASRKLAEREIAACLAILLLDVAIVNVFLLSIVVVFIMVCISDVLILINSEINMRVDLLLCRLILDRSRFDSWSAFIIIQRLLLLLVRGDLCLPCTFRGAL